MTLDILAYAVYAGRVKLVALGLLAWMLAGCGSDDGGSEPGEPAEPAAPAAVVEEQPSAISPTCTPPADCQAVTSAFLNVAVCCSESLRCGFDLSILGQAFAETPMLHELVQFDPAKPCWPREKIFLDADGVPEKRVPAADGGSILVATECRSRFVVNTTLAGCCLPDNRCAYSTHLATSAFSALAGVTTNPFSKPECVTAGELNEQLAASTLSAWAHIPEAKGSCDYAALDARL